MSNASMGSAADSRDGMPSTSRPYIRLTSQLRNLTKDAGEDVRLKCEAQGTPPLSFSWLKNYAPVETSKRIKIKTRESTSRLVITHLDVLDKGLYQCVVSNAAASVNTTSILQVTNVPGKPVKHRKPSHTSPEDYEDYEDAMERGRLPEQEDAELYSVPDNAGGAGFAPLPPSSRWLDQKKLRSGECVQYRGEACHNFLAGRFIMITTDNREEMYDIDRNLRAAMMFIANHPSVSPECRQYSQAVACYHMYKVCEDSHSSTIQQICKNDCERIQSSVCPNEYRMAAEHELVGDGPKALLPSCAALPANAANCIAIVDAPKQTTSAPGHQCYHDTGAAYEGTATQTESGRQCMPWSDSTSREFNVKTYPELRTARNRCRNPGGRKTKPWCFSRPMGREEYCDIPKCAGGNTRTTGAPSLNGTSPSNLSELWWSLPVNLQLTVMASVLLGVGLIFVLLCCLCCCRRGKKAPKQGAPQFSVPSAPTSLVASAANSGYCRKLQLNGSATPTLGRPLPMEMAALLPPNNNVGTGPPSYADSYRTHRDDAYHILEIPLRDLVIGDQVGAGHFGIFFAAQWRTTVSHEPITVALKTTRLDAPIAETKLLEDEVRRVAPFDHPNVTRLMGVVYLDGNRLASVSEYMIYGNVHDLISLKSSGSELEKRADNDEFIRIASQIAHGMEYLTSNRFVHRDLAARNCLVGDGRIVKVATFGMMRSAYEADYYAMMHRGRLPVRWMSREAIEGQRFSEASDVWAFGVTLWEMFSYGRTPYDQLSDQQVIGAISTRQLLECPSMCPPNIYSLMVECWTENPERRPTFAEIRPRLEAWIMNSPAHSLLQHRAASASTNSGSSGAGRPSYPQNRSHPPYHAAVRNAGGAGRRATNDEGSPLVRRDGAYDYSDDDEAAESD